MSNDSKPQPTGWVVVDFDAKFDQTFFGKDGWRYAHNACTIQPFDGLGDANVYRSGDEEVHPWPLPASVLDRLKEKHPGQDWSQVPVADAPAEKPGRWVIESLRPVTDRRYRDKADWHGTADRVSLAWKRLADVQGFMQRNYWSPLDYRVVNLDDLPSPAVAEPSEVEKLRAELEALRPYAPQPFDASLPTYTTLAKEHGEQQVEIDRLTRERDDARASVASVSKQLRREADEAIRERDEARAEAAANADTLQDWKRTAESALRQKDALDEELSRCKQAHSAAEDDVESLREQVSKLALSRALSRLDEFAKAALTGTLAQDTDGRLNTKETAEEAVRLAQATIRAIDGAGGA